MKHKLKYKKRNKYPKYTKLPLYVMSIRWRSMETLEKLFDMSNYENIILGKI